MFRLFCKNTKVDDQNPSATAGIEHTETIETIGYLVLWNSDAKTCAQAAIYDAVGQRDHAAYVVDGLV